MRIGLLRHFPVSEPFPVGWKTSAELQRWREVYEQAKTHIGPFDLGNVTWPSCLASDLPRARITAQTVFQGTIEFTPHLREAQFAPFPTGSLRLPVWAWKSLLQLAWRIGHSSQRACRDEFAHRVQLIADHLTTRHQDTLVVSHAGTMAFLSAELRRRGFRGPKLALPQHAKAYLFEKRE